MARKRYSAERVVAAVKTHEGGTSIGGMCRKLGISEATLYRWEKDYSGLEPDHVREFRQLRKENERHFQMEKFEFVGTFVGIV